MRTAASAARRACSALVVAFAVVAWVALLPVVELVLDALVRASPAGVSLELASEPVPTLRVIT